MATTRTSPYRGPLSPQLGADVSAAALRNAHRLIRDAEILVAAERWASAISLAVLAIEEAAKAEMVRLLVSARPEDLKDAWRAFRGHDFKQKSFTDAIRRAAAKMPKPIDPDLEPLDEMLSLLKELGFYVDIKRDGQGYAEPGDGSALDTPAAAVFVDIAMRRVEGTRASGLRDLELWYQHVGPGEKDEFLPAELAILNWEAAMKAEGLELP
jgi:AbiV family abortive infection protein